jgi:hypothetical protein
MKVSQVACPTCGAPAPENLVPNQQFKCPACGSILVLTDLAPHNQIACPQCNTWNGDERHFCSKCGAALQRDCPFCYTSNEASSMYCRSCGANLQAAWQRKQEWLAQKTRFDAKRVAAWQRAEAESRKNQLEKLLDDLDEPANHAMAIYCLNQLGSEAVEPLMNLLRSDPDPDARFGAAHALGGMGDPQAVPALMDALADPEPAVRYWAVDALARLRAEEAVEALAELLRDPHKGVRARAAEAMRELSDPSVEQAHKRKSRWWPFG